MYFEPAWHDGACCRDGGLTANNPVQVAVDEAKSIWGSNTVFDIIISLGSGEAKHPQRRPHSAYTLPAWVADTLNTLLKSMNGNAAWKKFLGSITDQNLRDRCNRLNVRFPGETEPALDDRKAINSMKVAAELFNFHNEIPNGSFSPILGSANEDLLQSLASRLKASFYFFELGSLKSSGNDIVIIKGWICCSLSPEKISYMRLIQGTSHFKMKGKEVVDIPTLKEKERLKLPITILQNASKHSEPIRIDAKFDNDDYLATISGFPSTLEVSLMNHLLPSRLLM